MVKHYCQKSCCRKRKKENNGYICIMCGYWLKGETFYTVNYDKVYIFYKIDIYPKMNCIIHTSTVESSFNQVIISATLVTLSPPLFYPYRWNTLPPFIQCGQELIIKRFGIHCELTIILNIWSELLFMKIHNPPI